MIDPTPFLNFLLHIFTDHPNFYSNPIVSGIIGNRADKYFGVGFDRVKVIWQKNKIPKNADLLRALQEANFKATRYLTKAVIDEIANRQKKDPGKVKSTDISVLKNQILPFLRNQELELTKAPEPNHNDPIFARLEILLAGANTVTAEQLRTELRSQSKQHLINTLQSRLNIKLPAMFVSMLLNGWKEKSKGKEIELDWFDIVTLSFSEILKDEKRPRIKEAFADRLLSDIKIDNTEIKINITEGLERLALSVSNIAPLLHNQIIQIKTLEDCLANLSIDINTVKNVVKEVNNKSTEVLKKLEILADEIHQALPGNQKLVYDLIDQIKSLAKKSTDLKKNIEGCKADLGTEVGQKLYSHLSKELKEVTKQFDDSYKQLIASYSAAHDFVRLKRETFLFLEDIEGKVAKCIDNMTMIVMSEQEYYVDLFTCDGKVEILETRPGSIFESKKEAGNFHVKTKFDRVYKSGEILKYSSTCLYIDSHTGNKESFIIWSEYPTLDLEVTVVFPIKRPYQAKKLYRKDLTHDRANYIEIKGITQKNYNGRPTLNFKLQRPSISDRYKIEWDW